MFVGAAAGAVVGTETGPQAMSVTNSMSVKLSRCRRLFIILLEWARRDAQPGLSQNKNPLAG
jgi:hypothetical protein